MELKSPRPAQLTLIAGTAGGIVLLAATALPPKDHPLWKVGVGAAFAGSIAASGMAIMASFELPALLKHWAGVKFGEDQIIADAVAKSVLAQTMPPPQPPELQESQPGELQGAMATTGV